MSNPSITPAESVHRLLFQALVQIRAEGGEHGNKVVYHLANLFHQVVLQMERAALGEVSFDVVQRFTEEKARELGLTGWLDSTTRLIESAKATVGNSSG